MLISTLPVWPDGVIICEFGMIFESVWIEAVVIGEFVVVLMNCPCGQPNSAVLWEEHAVVPIIWAL